MTICWFSFRLDWVEHGVWHFSPQASKALEAFRCCHSTISKSIPFSVLKDVYIFGGELYKQVNLLSVWSLVGEVPIDQ